MKDIKVLQPIDEGKENETINIWEKFGYTYRNSETVAYSKTNVKQGLLDYLFGWITVNNEEIRYVKLVMERDHDIPHYTELKKLEEEYESVPYPGDKAKPYSYFDIFKGLMLCTVPGVLMILKNKEEGRTPQEYAIALNQYNSRRAHILEKAAAIARS